MTLYRKKKVERKRFPMKYLIDFLVVFLGFLTGDIVYDKIVRPLLFKNTISMFRREHINKKGD